MEKYIRNRLIGASIGLILLVALIILTSHIAKKQHEANVVYEMVKAKMVMEAGYAQGQMDALKGIIRVRPINNSTCVWLSSPWGKLKPYNDTVSVNVIYK